MKKIILFVIIISIFSGCNTNVDEIEKLKIKNAELEVKLFELKEVELAKLQLEEKIVSLESDHNEEINRKNEKIELNEKYSLESYEYLKGDMIHYFESEQYINSKARDKNENSINVKGVELFMTRDEVKLAYGDEYTEEIFYEDASGYVYMYWTYKDGSKFQFNPTYLVSMMFISDEIRSNLDIKVNSNALESLNSLDKKYTRYSNIHMQDNSEDIFGYYYDDKTNTNIHIIIDDEIWNYDSVKNESIITKIRITASEWDFYN